MPRTQARWMTDALAAALGRLILRNPKEATAIATRYEAGELGFDRATDMAEEVYRRRLEMDAALDRMFGENDDDGYDVVAERYDAAVRKARGLTQD